MISVRSMQMETRVRVALTSPFGLLGLAMCAAALVGMLLLRAAV